MRERGGEGERREREREKERIYIFFTISSEIYTLPCNHVVCWQSRCTVLHRVPDEDHFLPML